MDVSSIHRLYRSGKKKPIDVVNQCLERISDSDTNAWIVTRDEESVRREAREIETKPRADLPLYGIPFAVKDNIDYKELPTTAGCPSYSYRPNEHATVVQSLIDAGAILLGKTNMDQFATGLVGTRSPHGPCKNVFNDEFISGGSSSGSAVAVANEQVCFALGTDTAGSGRIPAAFNGLVGLKPTRGLVSTHGVVPACKSLDCVSIFANSIDDATQIGQVAIGYDEKDPYSRSKADNLTLSMNKLSSPHIGVPAAENLEFFGDEEAESCFENAVGRAQSISESITHIDFTPFIKAAKLLYQGPWVAERFSAVGEFLETNPDDADPVVKRIIEGGADYSAVDVFEAFYELQTYKHQVANVFDSIDVLITPTAGTIYTIDEIDSNPIELNSNLGYYTNFANLLDLSAVSVPTGSFESGPSFGTTVFGEKYADSTVASVASELTNK